MKFIIKLPFSEIIFENAHKKCRKYFEDLFFAVKDSNSKVKYRITIRFQKINLSGDDIRFLEEDTTAKDGSIYISDTKGNKVEINPDLFESNTLLLQVDPNFDLYFLYNYIIEPLLIIWAAKHNILYVHSSAICEKEGASVFVAWRHTGKTSSIFNLAKEKIKFMGDDFCVIYNSKVYLYPKYINIFSYNFESYPWLYKKLPYSLALRIKISVLLKKLLFWISQKLSGSPSKVFFRLSELAEISTNTKVTPRQLGLEVQIEAPLRKVVFITKATKFDANKRKLDNLSIKQKLLAITTYEIKDFLNIYQKYKYLYPNDGQPIIETFEKNYLETVKVNLKNAYEVNIASLRNKDAYLKENTIK